MCRYLTAVVIAFVFSIELCSPSELTGGKKVALVVANGEYAYANALPNPIIDGRLIAQTLRDAGFAVIEGENLNKSAMDKLLDNFTEAAYEADIALLYYAGHGLQVDGINYLLPVDAKLEMPAQLKTRTVSMEDVFRAIPPDPTVSIIILDACRNNPMAGVLARSRPQSRSISAGLAPVQANEKDYNTGGVLIAYATDPGAVAYDGDGQGSPYTTALARYLTAPGLDIQAALTRVRADVVKITNGVQRPWYNVSLGRQVFLGEASGSPNPLTPAPSLPNPDNGPAGLSVLRPSTPATASSYAAIAVVPRQGLRHHGFATAETKSKARKAALQACGKSTCKIVQTYARGECAVTVLGKKQIFWNTDQISDHVGEIENSILSSCEQQDEDCRIDISLCL